MAKLAYDAADSIVYDPISGNRNSTRAALYALGFRQIETTGSLDSLRDYVETRMPDLVMCEAQGAETELCEMIQHLRQGRAGANPFTVIIVTTWEKGNALVSRVINSGADDLIIRPFSITLLGARIRIHTENRKRFVVTSDYVGPDRRRDGTRPPTAELFDVPNSLKIKAKEGLSADVAAQKVAAAVRTARIAFTVEKMRRDAFQICVLWRLLQDRLSGGQCHPEELARLRALSTGLARRVIDGEYAGAAQWCDAISSSVQAIEQGVDRNASMHLLGHAALSLNLVFDPGKDEEAKLAEVDAAVAVIRARAAQKMAS